MKEKFFHHFFPLSIYLLWLAAVFDPIGHFFGLRYVALIFIYATLFLHVLSKKLYFHAGGIYFFLCLYFVLILPGYGTLIYLIRGADAGGDFIDTSYIAAGVLFGCSLIYLNSESLQIGLAAQRFALRMMACTTIFCILIYELDLAVFIIDIFVENGAAFFGPFRNYGGVNFYYMYFVASPMLIYLVTQEVWRVFDERTRVQFFWCGVALVSLFMSGTRAHILLATFIIPFVYVWRRWGLLAVPVIGFTAVACLFLAYSLGVQSIASVFDPQNESIKLKLGFLAGYIEIFSDKEVLLFGQGFNAHRWSDAFANMLPGGALGVASKTELTYIEIIRVFGLVVGGAFFCLMACLVKKLSEMDFSLGWMAPAVFLYLVGSTLNPYVFSSNGMLPLGLCAAALHGYLLKNVNLKRGPRFPAR